MVPGKYGLVNPEDVRKRIRKSEGSQSHFPNASLICLENTSNRGGGTCYSLETLTEIGDIARESDCRMHLDGARFFNAVGASGNSASELVAMFDSVSICLSKGLGAPVGSVLVGSKPFIQEAHRWRKMFGGGMRQSGILAAAGLYALEQNFDRLKDDHDHARKLAESIQGLHGLHISMDTVQSNMVYVQTEESADSWKQKLEEQGVLCFALGENTLRLVTHLHIDEKQIEEVSKVFENLSRK